LTTSIVSIVTCLKRTDPRRNLGECGRAATFHLEVGSSCHLYTAGVTSSAEHEQSPAPRIGRLLGSLGDRSRRHHLRSRSQRAFVVGGRRYCVAAIRVRERHYGA